MHRQFIDLNGKTLAFAMGTLHGGKPTPDSAIDLLASIGYEAADPRLQAPLWVETMCGQPTQADLR